MTIDETIISEKKSKKKKRKGPNKFLVGGVLVLAILGTASIFIYDYIRYTKHKKWQGVYKRTAKTYRIIPSPLIYHAQSEDDLEKIIKEDKYVLVQISTMGCKWCLYAYNDLVDLKKKDKFQEVKFVYLDKTNITNIAGFIEKYGFFSSVPYFIYFEDGEKKESWDGYFGDSEIFQIFIEELVKKYKKNK